MQPSIGRIVHYQTTDEYPGRHVSVAAIVTAVGPDDHVSLTLFYEGEQPEFLGSVPYADQPAPGHWNWPPRLGPNLRGTA